MLTRVVILLCLATFQLHAQESHQLSLDQMISNQSFDEAKEFLNENWNTLIASNDPVALNKLGSYAYRVAELGKSVEAYRNNFLAVRKINDEDSEPYIAALTILGNAYQLDGNFLLASKIFLKLIELNRNYYGRVSYAHANALCNYGNLMLMSGKIEESDGFFTTAINITEKIGKPSALKVNILSAYANYKIVTGYYSIAENFLRQALFVAASHPVKSTTMTQTYMRLAKLYIQLNNVGQAATAIANALKILEQTTIDTHPERGSINVLKSKINLLMRNSAIANAEAMQAVKLLEGLPGYSSNLLDARLTFAASLAQANHLSSARESLLQPETDNRANDVKNSYRLGRILELQASINHQEGNFDAAITQLDECLSIRKRNFEYEHPDYLRALTKLSLVYWAKGDIGQAEKYFSRSIHLYKIQYLRQYPFLSEKEKELFYETIKLYFNKYTFFTVEHHKSHPNLVGDLMSSRLLFKGLLYNSIKNLKERVLSNDRLLDRYREYERVKERLGIAYKVLEFDPSLQPAGLDSLENLANYLEKEISLRSQIGNRHEDILRLNLNWEDLRESLPSDALAIDVIHGNYYDVRRDEIIGDSTYYVALGVSRNVYGNPDFVMLQGNDLDGKYYSYYRNAIRLKIQDETSYDQFWKPIEDQFDLRKYKQVYFSPDGIYSLINPATLFNPSDNEYLFEQCDVRIIGNPIDIIKSATNRDTRALRAPSLLIGSPDYGAKPTEQPSPERNFLFDVTSIPELPGTLTEVTGIGDLFMQEQLGVEVLTGEAANEEALKAKTNFSRSPQVLHIASHGFFNPEAAVFDPLSRSGLLLAQASHYNDAELINAQLTSLSSPALVQDGVLTAQEAMNLDLGGTELVVLSACETGLGVVRSGEGVYGLQRAFQTAGANAIIMSLWKVDDESTQKFMTTFYREWVRSRNKHQAFRKAEAAIREEYTDPYYWGAFVLVGG